MIFFIKCHWLCPCAYLCGQKWINRIFSKLARGISKILFFLESYNFLACLECVRSYAWSKGHSDPDLCSVVAKCLLDETLGQLKEWIYGKKSCNSGFVNCWTAGAATNGQRLRQSPFARGSFVAWWQKLALHVPYNNVASVVKFKITFFSVWSILHWFRVSYLFFKFSFCVLFSKFQFAISLCNAGFGI